MKNFNERVKNLGRMLLLSTVLFIAGTNIAKAQPGCPVGTPQVDLAAVSIGPYEQNIGLNQTVQIFVAMTNNGPCDIPTGEAEVQVTFSDVYLDVNGLNPNFMEDCSFGLPGAGPEFVYLGEIPQPGFHVLYFRNDNGPMEINSSCYFYFDIKGKAVTTVPTPISLASSLSATATSSDQNGNNQSASAQVNVIIPLAVKLSAFTAELSDCKALLKWTTAQETNSKEYQLEVSGDGRTFIPVGVVAAAGNSSNALSYSFIDKAPLDGQSFYRLKMISNDGLIEYSNVAPINNKCNAKSVRIYPNPVVENQQFGVFVNNYKGKVKGEILSVSGQLIQTVTLTNGTNILPVNGLKQGTYMLRVTEVSSGETESFKVVVIK